MAQLIRGIHSLELFELLSAPLVAMIQADAQAARATVEFIEAVGFVAPEPGAGEDREPGRLRMAHFRYQKLDENNDLKEFVVSVPLLALVPIPSLQIKQARVSLLARITDVAAEKPAAEPAAPAGGIPARRLRIFAKPVASSGAKGREVRASFDLEVQISLGQADLPAGMEKVFNVLDQAICERKSGAEP